MMKKRNPPPASRSPVSPETIPAAHAHHAQSQRLPAWFGLVLGIGLFVLMRILPPPGDMSANAWAVAAVAALMAIWWLTEAIPVPATALLPLALFPLLGQGSIKAVAAPFANPLIFLFLGGFLIALAVERWGLHKRMALFVLSRAGTRPRQLVGAFMVTAAGLRDRKSTRLNSSHRCISYAVFCLKKKKRKKKKKKKKRMLTRTR